MLHFVVLQLQDMHPLFFLPRLLQLGFLLHFRGDVTEVREEFTGLACLVLPISVHGNKNMGTIRWLEAIDCFVFAHWLAAGVFQVFADLREILRVQAFF